MNTRIIKSTANPKRKILWRVEVRAKFPSTEHTHYTHVYGENGVEAQDHAFCAAGEFARFSKWVAGTDVTVTTWVATKNRSDAIVGQLLVR